MTYRIPKIICAYYQNMFSDVFPFQGHDNYFKMSAFRAWLSIQHLTLNLYGSEFLWTRNLGTWKISFQIILFARVFYKKCNEKMGDLIKNVLGYFKWCILDLKLKKKKMNVLCFSTHLCIFKGVIQYTCIFYGFLNSDP